MPSSSIIVEYLMSLKAKDANMSLAYVYCEYLERRDHTAANLLANIAQQLIHDDSTMLKTLLSLYRHHLGQRTRPTLSDWSNLLQSGVRRQSRVFILIDAIDERRDEDGTVDDFLRELKGLTPDVHLFITSRPSSTIERELKIATHMEIRARDPDIRAYVHDHITRGPRLQRLVDREPTLKAAIADTVIEKSQGM